MIITAVFVQAILFQIFSQVSKRLREKGASGLHIFYYLRLALYPSLAALFYFWSFDDISYLIHHRTILAVFIVFILCQTAFQYIYFISRHMVRSLTFVSTILDAVGLPLSLAGGFLINQNIPTAYQILAIGLLMIAVFLKPSTYSKSSTERQALYAMSTLIGIVASYLVLQFIKDPLYREFLTHMPSLWFAVALFMVSATLLINIFFLFKKVPDSTVSNDPGIKKLIYAIPLLWFLGSLPEGYSFASLPVYTIVAIGTISFLMSLISDIYHKRVRFDLRTGIFAALACVGIVLSIVPYR